MKRARGLFFLTVLTAMAYFGFRFTELSGETGVEPLEWTAARFVLKAGLLASAFMYFQRRSTGNGRQ